MHTIFMIAALIATAANIYIITIIYVCMYVYGIIIKLLRLLLDFGYIQLSLVITNIIYICIYNIPTICVKWYQVGADYFQSIRKQL